MTNEACPQSAKFHQTTSIFSSLDESANSTLTSSPI